MNKLVVVAAGGAASVCAAVVGIPVGFALLFASVGGGAATDVTTDCALVNGSVQDGAYSAEQVANATTVVQTVVGRGLSPADAVIAVMTALTESSLVNVDHGDAVGPDSTGLFQQRDSWGSRAVRNDPAGATGLFLNAMTSSELQVYGSTVKVNTGSGSRARLAPWVVAQSVQRSGFADGSNYRANYAAAVDIVQGLLGDDVAGDLPVPWSAPTVPLVTTTDLTDLPAVAGLSDDDGTAACSSGTDEGGADEIPAGDGGAVVEKMIATASAQIGKPYVWAAAGPDSFDCSGLVQYAYAAAGISLPHDSRQQYALTLHVPLSEAQRGDLVFWARNGRVYHVAIFLGTDANGTVKILAAPKPGDHVKVEDLWGQGDTLLTTAGRVVEG